MEIVAGIDLGGTYVKGVIINGDGEILLQHHLATNGDQAGWQNSVIELYQYLISNSSFPVDSVGLSGPGLASEENNCIKYMPGRLPGLEGLIWQEHFGKKTYVLNDAHAALMAEARFGKLKGKKNGVMLTLGTGVGGGIMINGELYQGKFQRAGSLGHICLNSEDDERDVTGIPGALEYALGNYSVERRSMGRFKSTKELVDAHINGDKIATWLWLDSIRKLALGCSSLVNVLSPELIVLSGGIVLAGDELFGPLNEFMKYFEYDMYGEPTPILRSDFDDMAGSVGAAAFAISKLRTEPSLIA
jgi:glucokinase